MKIIISNKFAKLLTCECVSKLSRLMRVSYGWWCVSDVMSVDDNNVNKKCDNMKPVNRYDILQHESSDVYDKDLATVSPACEVAEGNNKVLNIKQRGLTIGSQNFQGLCSGRKALEIGEVLSKNHINIVGGQESWELNNSKIYVPGYKWFGKPREGIKGKRGEGGVGFLAGDLLMEDVIIIINV